jgi:hypothetical protein
MQDASKIIIFIYFQAGILKELFRIRFQHLQNHSGFESSTKAWQMKVTDVVGLRARALKSIFRKYRYVCSNQQ